MKKISDWRRIARQFCHLVRDELSKDEVAQVIERNKQNPESECATHDFCDANVLMAEAFERAMDRSMRLESQVDMALVNGAWGIAKARHFKPEDC